MENNTTDTNIDPITVGFGIAAAVAILFNTTLTIAKEFYPPLLAWMKRATWHHWTTQGFLVLGVFLLLGWLLARRNIPMRGIVLTKILVTSVVIGGLGIVGLYLII